MRTWIIKPEFRKPGVWPDDMLCVEIPGDCPEDRKLLWIHHDGVWDIEDASMGIPNPDVFDVYE